jgi:NitT/TauT family transport system substrate-binding protein
MKKIIISLLALIFFIGCNKKEPPIRLALVEWIGYAPIYVAKEKGYLPKNIKLVEYTSNYNIIEAMKNETVEFASLTLDEVLILKNSNYKAIWFIDYSNGADSILAEKSIPDVKHLKNKIVAYEPNSVQEYLLTRALYLNNLTKKDIKPLFIKYDRALEVWEQHKANAIVTFEPFKSKLLNKGMHVIFDSSKIPNEISDLIVANTKIFKTNKKTIKEFIKAYQKGYEYLKNNPKESYKIIAKYLHTTPDSVKTALNVIKLLGCKENYNLAKDDAKQLKIVANNVIKTLQIEGILKQTPNIQNIFYFKYIKDMCK